MSDRSIEGKPPVAIIEVEMMVRVSEVTDGDAPLVLIVDNNPMALYRLKEIFLQRGYRIIECEDGDKAVDQFITEKPDIVVLSLDIPSLDGHIAALEMRESRFETRIILTAPRSKSELAADAAYSAGAVAWVEKPVSKTSIDKIWDQVIGNIPEAPGLEDLDDLYPEVEEEEIEVIPEIEALPLPPPPSELPPLPEPPKPRKSKRGLLYLAIFLFIGAAGAIGYGLYDMGIF